MAATSAARHVALDPGRAWSLWADVSRWPAFIEGFAHVVERSADWPQVGARVVWDSGAGGRGRVTEQVTASEPGERLATQISEQALTGVQVASFSAAEDGRTRVELQLDYELSGGGALRAITDVLFIRRALGQALQRTLARFAAEAADEEAV